MITFMCWPKRMNFNTETHFGGGVMSAFVFPLTTIAQVPSFDICRQYSSQEMLTAMITMMYWSMHAKTHPCDKSCEHCNNFCPLLVTIACLIQTAWSSRIMHINWNEVSAGHLCYTGSLWTGIEYELGMQRAMLSKTCYRECGCHLR